jgi:phage gp45-like
MHRATPANSSFRGYVSGGARAIVLEVDDSKLMQEHTAQFLINEQRDTIETPHTYGFTSVCMDADKDNDGNITACAETFMAFIGGNRTLNACGPMDDRRHRLKDLNKGDVAMFRLKDDRQQLHMVKDPNGKYIGTYLSTRDDMVWRFAMVPQPQQQQQNQQSGGGSAGGQQLSGSQSQQQYGQENCLEDNTNSKMFFEETKDHHLMVHNQNTFEQQEDQTHIDYDEAHWIIQDDQIIGYLNNDPTISVRVASDHVHILFKKFAVWVNKGGCFSTVRPVIAQDPDAG